MENSEKQELKCNVLKMCNGAVAERIDAEMGNIIENIWNLNTEAKKKRQLIITIDLVPSDDRRTVAVAAQAKSKLMPFTAVQTMLCVGPDGNGELMAIEATQQTPGQMGFDGGEQKNGNVINLGAKQAQERG